MVKNSALVGKVVKKSSNATSVYEIETWEDKVYLLEGTIFQFEDLSGDTSMKRVSHKERQISAVNLKISDAKNQAKA